jgi:hypothetical protein
VSRIRHRSAGRAYGSTGLAGLGFGLIALVFLVAVVGGVWYTLGTKDTVTFTVTDKERITESSTDGGTTSKYLIFTDTETFENTDTMLYGKFNSSDVYGRLKEGKQYTCEVYGWRIGLFSTYRNIVSCEAA